MTLLGLIGAIAAILGFIATATSASLHMTTNLELFHNTRYDDQTYAIEVRLRQVERRRAAIQHAIGLGLAKPEDLEAIK